MSFTGMGACTVTFDYCYTCTCGESISNRIEHDLHTLKHELETIIVMLEKKKWYQFWKR